MVFDLIGGGNYSGASTFKPVSRQVEMGNDDARDCFGAF